MKNANFPKVRKVSIYFKPSQRQWGFAYVPFISLSGKWLEQCGFQAGHVVDVTCEDRKLTITIAAEQKFAELQELFQKEKIEIM